jgi:hypothetical protein
MTIIIIIIIIITIIIIIIKPHLYIKYEYISYYSTDQWIDGLCPSCISLIERKTKLTHFTHFERGRAGYNDEQRRRNTAVEQCQWKRTRPKECARALYSTYNIIIIPNTLRRQTARILLLSF